MKTRMRTICAALACLAMAGLISPLDARGSIEEITPPVRTFTMANGIKVFHVPDELPELLVEASVGFGKMYEKKQNAGISELFARTLSLCGSKKYPGVAMHEKIESLGGSLSVLPGHERTVIRIKVLRRFKDAAFDILSDLVLHPDFNAKSLDAARTLMLDQIRRRYDEPGNLAMDKAREILYQGDGYGSFPTGETVGPVTLKDIEDIHDKYFRGSNMMLGMATSLNFDEARRMAEASLSGVRPGPRVDYETNREALAAAVRQNAGKVFFYPKKIPQATVVVVGLAPEIAYMGNYAVDLMNYMLGGGSFNSRIMNDIRVKRGLAYTAMSVVRHKYRTGLFLAFVQTNNESADLVVNLIRKNIDDLLADTGFSDELKWAKSAVANSYIFNFTTPAAILSNYMEKEYNNLPDNYFADYVKHMNAVTEDEVLREGRAVFADGLIRVVVGNPSIKDRLSKLGEVVEIK